MNFFRLFEVVVVKLLKGGGESPYFNKKCSILVMLNVVQKDTKNNSKIVLAISPTWDASPL